MSRYLLRLGGRVLATALFTGALFLGFVANTAAGDFILWTGLFTADGVCKVTAVDQSDEIVRFTGTETCSGLMGAIQKLGEGQNPDFVCTQAATQSHIVPPPALDLDDFDDLDDFLPEQLVGRVFRVGVTGEARCDPPAN